MSAASDARNLHFCGEAALAELCIIFPLIASLTLLLVFYGLRTADRAVADRICEKYASEAARCCAFGGYRLLAAEDSGSDASLSDVINAYSETVLYRYILPDSEVVRDLESELCEKLAAASLMKYSKIKAEIKLQSGLGGNYICVDFEKAYPDEGLYFFVRGITLDCRCRVNDFAELTRVTDLVSDVGGDVAAYVKSSGILNKSEE